MNRHGSFASLDDWLAWLDTLSPREIELGLERVRDVLARMDLPQAQLVIHVAGTNGKGSTANMLEALLLQAGRRVGCYTSPHVRCYNERIRIQGRELDDEAIVAAFRDVEAARNSVILTYFEFGTLAALAAFAKAGCEVLVLEIGLGGRLDAVNAVEPDAAIITNIGLDHCDWLGDSIDAIAREKAGVMRMNTPVIYGAESVPEAIVDEAAQRNADLRVAGRDFHVRRAQRGWHWRGRKVQLDNLALPALEGDFQVGNAAAALAALEALGCTGLLDAGTVNAALASTGLPGRLQRIEGRHRWLLDVAHNPDAAAVLAASLGTCAPGGRLVAVIGVLADKDLEGILRALCPVVDEWIAVPAAYARALEAVALAARIANACQRPCRIGADIRSGLEQAAGLCGRDDSILVTGSFYTVGPALEYLEAGGA